MRKFIVLIISLCISVAAWSIPATPEPIVRLLEDGSTDTVYLHGDETYHYMTDVRGRVVEGSAIRTDIAAAPSRAPQRTMLTSFVPKKGTVRIPVILVNFSDVSFTLDNAQEQFDDLFNGKGGSNPNATGSVRTYYMASSDSALDLVYEVYGPYTLSKALDYYGENKTSGSYTDHNVHAKELVTEAVTLAVNAGVDMTPYDNNNDGYVDNVSIVVAGYNEAEGGKAETIWPHYSMINSGSKFGGKYLSGYLMISEYRGSGGKVQAGIGTYCHEFGHALGLPDLYDTGKDAYTVGSWDIMCSGSYNNNGSTPPSYTAFERFMMGWMVPEEISSPCWRTLAPIETSNTAFLIAASTHNLNPSSPNPREYFLLENRQRVGWDAGTNALIAPGLMISHVTFNATNWEYNTFNNQKPLGFAIVSAGFDEPTQSSAADIFPGTTQRTSWIPTLNNGTQLTAKTVSQIRQRNDLQMTLQIGDAGSAGLQFTQEEVQIETPYLNGIVSYDTAKVTLQVDSIAYDTLAVYVSSSLFTFSLDQGLTWYRMKDGNISLPIRRDSIYSLPIWVLHLPTKRSCKYSYGMLTAETPDGQLGAQVTLAGRSPRPTYITTPVIDSVYAITSSSFTISWINQEDANMYYYTLFTKGEGESEEVENFENFASEEAIRESGWSANFVNSQSTVAHSGRAVLFTQTGQYIQSPYYILAPKQIYFWISNNLTPDSNSETTGGMLEIQGSADGKTWKKLALYTIQRTTKNIIRTLDLNPNDELHQFRAVYEHQGGNGGVVMDDWSAVYANKIDYIYPLQDNFIYAPDHTIIFSNLQPDSTYYFAVQAFEDKGCEAHYTRLSELYAVHTDEVLPGNTLKTIRTGVGQYSVVFPEIADGKHYVSIYTTSGQQIARLRPAYGTVHFSLPPLPVGHVYFVKYYSGRMKRKDLRTKIMSY